MVDMDTFLTTLYVMVDDFCKSEVPATGEPGPEPSLSQGEVVTLCMLSQWSRFRNQRDFYRFAELMEQFAAAIAAGNFDDILGKRL